VKEKVFSNHYYLISIWAAYWLLIFGATLIFFKPMGYNYEDAPLFNFLYFTCFAYLGLTLFETKKLSNLYHQLNRSYLLKILATYIFYLLLTSLLAMLFPITSEKTALFKKWNIMFIEFSLPTSLAKSAEILFQQTLTFSLVMRLIDIFKDKKITIVMFGVAFFIIHIPLLIFMPDSGWFFIIPAVGAGVLFAASIVNYQKGLILSHVIHLGFYILLGVYLRYLW
jgi:hypothetical protein